MSEDEAIATLSARDSYASMRPIESHGLAITIVAQKTRFLPIAIIGMTGGLIALLAGIYLLRHPQPEWNPISSSGSYKLIMLGVLVLTFTPMVALIRVINGPPRNVELDAIPGQLKADRSIAGDRVVSRYGLEEVLCLFNESNVLCIETRKGHSQLVAFGRRPINEAVAYLLARHFWFPLEIDVVHAKQGMLGKSIDRTVFIPKAKPITG